MEILKVRAVPKACDLEIRKMLLSCSNVSAADFRHISCPVAVLRC